MANKTSKTGMLHPYQRPDFWFKPENQYWESDSYTEDGKEYGRNFLNNILKTDKRQKDGKTSRN